MVEPPALKTITADVLQKTVIPPVIWLVEDILTEGLTIIAGSSKVGKSIFAINLIVAVATESKALGKFTAKKGTVLYLALEDPLRRIQERFKPHWGDAGAPPNLHFVEKAGFPRLDAGGMDQLEGFVKDHPDTKLIVIDTWSKVSPARSSKKTLYENDADNWTLLFNFAQKHRISVVVLHHTRKSVAGDSDDWLDEISGSMGVTASADSIIRFTRKRGGTSGKIDIATREGEERSYALEGDYKMKKWLWVGDAEKVFMSEARNEILDYLKENPGKEPWQIAEDLEKKKSTVRVTLMRMLENEEIRKVDKGYHLPYTPTPRNGVTDVTGVMAKKGRYSVTGGNKRKKKY
jgi:RecA-family ATPase